MMTRRGGVQKYMVEKRSRNHAGKMSGEDLRKREGKTTPG